ncbi:MAG: hypothetical protein AAFN65_04535, partial [Bacteroidota bacterium]
TYIDGTKVHVTFTLYDNRKFTGRVSFNHSGTCNGARITWVLYDDIGFGAWRTSRTYTRNRGENKNFEFDEYLSALDFDVIQNGNGYRIVVDRI